MLETWLPIPDWPMYEVSDHGRVKSLARTVTDKHGRVSRRREVVLKQVDCNGYGVVSLYRSDGTRREWRVHILVAAAFLGPMPTGCTLVRHLNDVPRDNRLENLAYGNASSNGLDAVRNGKHPESSKTHCDNGHEFTPENTAVYGGHRYCIACRHARVERDREKLRKRNRERMRAVAARKRAAKENAA